MLSYIKNKYYICSCSVMVESLHAFLYKKSYRVKSDSLRTLVEKYLILPDTLNKGFFLSQTLSTSLIGTDRSCYKQRNISFSPAFFLLFDFLFLRLVLFPFFSFCSTL